MARTLRQTYRVLLRPLCLTLCLQAGQCFWAKSDALLTLPRPEWSPWQPPASQPLRVQVPKLRSWEEIRLGVNKPCTQLLWLPNGAELTCLLGEPRMSELVTNQGKANR